MSEWGWTSSCRLTHLSAGALCSAYGLVKSVESSIFKVHTSLIVANVFDNIEIKTKRVVSFSLVSEHSHLCHSNLLVNNKVFDNAAKHVIKNGPKIGWKLDA